MSATASEIITIDSGLAYWEVYEPEVKANLSSCAVLIEDRLFLFDPVRLSPDAWEELTQNAKPTAIILTNANHQRASLEMQKAYGIPILAPLEAKAELIADEWLPSSLLPPGLEFIALPGFGVGETAFYLREKNILIVGDALINLPRHGFSALPDKYCTHPKTAERSLEKLLNLDISLLLMAHGEPLRNPKTRLSALCANS